MNALDVALLNALRTSSVHLPIGDLARQLGVLPSDVHARFEELRSAGFGIEDHPTLGVRLLSTPDRLIADDLVALLGPCALVREIVVFEQTASTNDLASQRGRQGAAGGLVIFAERQSAGRGRLGRNWASASHRGLWFSLLLRPALPLACWPRLTTWAAVAIAEAVEQRLALRVAIKWPNDLFVNGRKFAGILAETCTDAGAQPFAVVGIGINVNHEQEDFPFELAGKAGSLRQAVGRPIDRPALAASILAQLDVRILQLDAGFEEIIAEARARSFLLGRWIQVRSGDAITEGRAEQLDENGHLLLRTADGALKTLSGGEVTVIAS